MSTLNILKTKHTVEAAKVSTLLSCLQYNRVVQTEMFTFAVVSVTWQVPPNGTSLLMGVLNPYQNLYYGNHSVALQL